MYSRSINTIIISALILSTVVAVYVYMPHEVRAGFTYYSTITVDRTKVSNTDQTNFPVLIDDTFDGTGGEPDLRTVANGGKVQNASGYDIGFYTSSNCTTGKMDWEMESYSASTGRVIYWVKVGTLSTSVDTVFYMCYGDASISTDQSAPTSAWSNSFQAVWHLGEGNTAAAGAILDSTSSNLDGTKRAAAEPNSVTTGKIGGAMDFDNSDDYILGVSSTSPSTALTIEAWINPVTCVNTDVVLQILDSDNFPNVQLRCRSTRRLSFLVIFNNGGSVVSGQWDTADNAVTLNTLQHVAVTYDGSSTANDAVLYINGNSVALATDTNPTAGTFSTALGTWAIGNNPLNFIAQWDNIIDEVRLSSAVRSADWLKTGYNNQNSTSTFYTVGFPVAPAPDTGTGNKAVINGADVIIDGGTIIIP